MIMTIRGGCLRRNTSSDEQRRCQKVWSNIRSNVSDNSINEDKYPKGIEQREAMKYLKGKLLPPH